MKWNFSGENIYLRMGKGNQEEKRDGEVAVEEAKHLLKNTKVPTC